MFLRKNLWIASVLMLTITGIRPALANENVSQWQCKAIGENVGKTDPTYASDIMRWPDDRFRIVERGSDYYTGENPDDPQTVWLDIYAVPNGHGNTFIGYLKKENFECIPFQG